MGCGIERATVAVQQRRGCVVHSAGTLRRDDGGEGKLFMRKQLLGFLLLVIAGCGSESHPETSNAAIDNGAKSNEVMDAVVEDARPAKSLSPATKADVSVVLERERSLVTALPLDREVADLGVFAAGGQCHREWQGSTCSSRPRHPRPAC